MTTGYDLQLPIWVLHLQTELLVPLSGKGTQGSAHMGLSEAYHIGVSHTLTTQENQS